MPGTRTIDLTIFLSRRTIRWPFTGILSPSRRIVSGPKSGTNAAFIYSKLPGPPDSEAPMLSSASAPVSLINYIIDFWPRAKLRCSKRSFAVLVVAFGVETWSKKCSKLNKKCCKSQWELRATIFNYFFNSKINLYNNGQFSLFHKLLQFWRYQPEIFCIDSYWSKERFKLSCSKIWKEIFSHFSDSNFSSNYFSISLDNIFDREQTLKGPKRSPVVVAKKSCKSNIEPSQTKKNVTKIVREQNLFQIEQICYIRNK